MHLQSARSNMQSAKEHSQVIEEYHQKESAKEHSQVIEEYHQKETMAGGILGPFSPHSVPKVHINRFGVIPKRCQPGKWRLITVLSFPNGHSINAAIPPSLCTLQYILVDQVALAAAQMSQRALLAKTNIRAAYRLIPIHPKDRIWLGMKWEKLVYVNGMLPLGWRSLPNLYNAVADALEWCIHKQG